MTAYEDDLESSTSSDKLTGKHTAFPYLDPIHATKGQPPDHRLRYTKAQKGNCIKPRILFLEAPVLTWRSEPDTGIPGNMSRGCGAFDGQPNGRSR